MADVQIIGDSEMNQEQPEDNYEESYKERRTFPRIDTECPVMYAIGSSKKWNVGVLMNFSATGLSMRCKDQLLKSISINIMTKPGSNKLIPAITAFGKVVRCESLSRDGTNEEFKISCKLTKVKPS